MYSENMQKQLITAFVELFIRQKQIVIALHQTEPPVPLPDHIFVHFFRVLKSYSGSVVKTQIQSFYNELIDVVEEGEGCSPYAA